MKSVEPSPRKRGISLSSSHKPQQTVPTPILIHSQPSSQPLPLPPHQWIIHAPRPQVQPPKQPAIIRAPQKPPVIIYRYRKSEWQQLQQANRIKRQTVNRMRSQIQHLNRQVQRKSVENIQRSLSLGRNGQGMSVDGRGVRVDVVSDWNVVHQPKVTQFDTINKTVKEQSSSTKVSSLQTTCKQNIMEMYKIEIKSPKKPKKAEQPKPLAPPSNKQNMQMQATQIQKIEGNSKHYRLKKGTIDIKSLIQIQNRLQRLIDFTNS